MFLTPGEYMLEQPIRITAPAVRIECAYGAVLHASNATGGMLIQADDVVVQGCMFLGGVGGVGILIQNAKRVQVLDNELRETGGYAVYLVDVADCLVSGNRIIAPRDIAIFAEGDISGLVVQNNWITTSKDALRGTHAIAVHSTYPGRSVRSCRVIANRIEQNSSFGFCVEVGAFGGDRAQTIAVRENSCQAESSTAGGYSFDAVDYGDIADNSYGSRPGAARIAGIELVRAAHIQVFDNKVSGHMATGFSIDRSSESTFKANRLDWSFMDENAAAVHLQVSAEEQPTSRANQLIGNTIQLRISAPRQFAIWLQANNKQAVLAGNVVEQNSITGSAEPNCVTLERDSGELKDSSIAGNRCTPK